MKNSTSNWNWICFDCRITVRRSWTYKNDVPCPRCQKNCVHFGTEIALPPAADLRAWRKIRRTFQESRADSVEHAKWQRVRRQHRLEWELVELEKSPASGKRDRRIAHVRVSLGVA